jgi:alkylation response protein AidB-like acyl-CoA dehydrogenase
MDFSPSPEQQALKDSLRRLLDRDLDFEARRTLVRADEGAFRELWAKLAELGCLGAGLGEDLGGFGGDASDMAMIAQELGRTLAPLPYTAHVMGLALLSRAPSADPEILAGMTVGERCVMPALLEPGARGDLGQVATMAVRQGDHFEISGIKAQVEGVELADHFLVSARVTPDEGVALFLVDVRVAGISNTPYRTVANMRVSDIGFHRVSVPAAACVSPDASALIASAEDIGIVMTCAQSLGAMDAALWLTRDYLRARKQFGQPLAAFQALQHRMADMLIETELARSMLFQALAALEASDPATRRRGVSAAKVQNAEAGMFVGGQAIQLHGAIGMTEEYVLAHLYKLLFANARQFGGPDLHLERFIAAGDRPLPDEDKR